MSHSNFVRFGLAALLLAVLGLRSATVLSDATYTHGSPPTIAQIPLYMRDAVPPLNMLVMGKDHKIYYEAYNDASDLNGDRVLDVGYKPALTYYGYFNSNVCYNWNAGDPGDGGGGRFVPATATANKQCSGAWSGDFLNYLTTSRMDALRRVLYGGWRKHDTASSTVLQGAFFPQDAHSWGKEYQSVARDGYDIRNYTPLALPSSDRYHLFAVTTTTGNGNSFPNYQAPLFRVLANAPFRVWNWLSIEGPVAGNNCFNSSNQRVNCESGGTAQAHPGHPANRAEFTTMENNYAIPAYRFGSGSVDNINCTSNDCNPYGVDDNYLTIITGNFQVGNSAGSEGTFQFSVDGDDAVDFDIRAIGGANALGQAGYYGGHDVCNCNTYSTGSVALARGTNYAIRFRHEEAGGGDKYVLRYRKRLLSFPVEVWGAWETVPAASGNGQNGLTGLTRTTYNLAPVLNRAVRTDYLVRVETCPASNAALREASCKAYPGVGGNASYKPTGILHDYGENQRMYFGLITGSQRNNLEGGVLRRNVSNFAEEIDANTGAFRTDVEGIARSISRLRMIGGGYNSGTDNTNADQNWNWNLGTGNCDANAIQGNPITNGQCRMWGNPIAEMMYESMRYFAGANAATPRFVTGGTSQGIADEDILGLPVAGWRDPYGNDPSTGLNYPSCARPYQTVLSDINPSYDGDLPGTGFTGANTSVGATPAAIAGFSAQNEGAAIWNAEGLGSRNVFIGEAGTLTDGNPTGKPASSFGNIRGLAPEEPSKLGTYYSASVARFARNNDISAAPDAQVLSTYAIALASPLPRIQFPLGGQTVTLLPFAKTVSGTFGGGTRKPTNTIVDFYVEEYFNFPGQTVRDDINQGRPRAVFRINYEDVEQGNDHDMDAIVRYEVVALSATQVRVDLSSDYAAGSANQNIGYVMSGSTADGIYLEVRDRDSGQASSVYELNTPAGVAAGGCVGRTGMAPCNEGLGFSSTRTFTAGTTGGAEQLRDPLWYAAKYGAPDLDDWDSEVPGEPDNYFLVTNPLNLREQLSRAFDDIASRDVDVGNTTVSGARVQAASFTLEPAFARNRDGADWTGDLAARAVNPDGSLVPGSIWSAQGRLNTATPAARNILTVVDPLQAVATNRTKAFRADADFGDNLPAAQAETRRLDRIGIANAALIPTIYGGVYDSTQLINYLRGDRANEPGGTGASKTLRQRGAVLGDIINSEPVVFSPRSDFGYGAYDSDAMFSGYRDTGSSGYLRTKRGRKPVAYVGANDGMLHAFDASTTPCENAEGDEIACATADSGNELFGFIPHGVLRNMSLLALPDNLFEHRYYVDGQQVIGDAKSSTGWKTLLVGTTGGAGKQGDPAAGRSIYGLDISEINSRTGAGALTPAKVLWERNSTMDRDIGRLYGRPLLLPLENNRWGVLFGNGYGGDRSDPSLYILDAFDGSIIRKITGDDGQRARNSLLGVIIAGACDLISTVFNIDCMARPAHGYNGLGQIVAVDRDGNGKADTVYGGDLQGNLWKFDLRGNNTGNWNVYNFASGGGRVPLFTAQVDGERQPITGALEVSAGPGNGVMVFFGTGRYLFQGDNEVIDDPQVQALYGVYDNGPVTGNAGSSPAGGRANLVAQRIVTQEVSDVNSTYRIRTISRNTARYFGANAVRGWYLDLKLVEEGEEPDDVEGDGERFIARPQIQSGRVFFTTYIPDPNDTGCAPGGLNWQYALDVISGAGALSNVAMINGDIVCSGADCGGVTIVDEQGRSVLPPITNSGLLSTRPTVTLPDGSPGCDPATGECPEFEQCQVVVYPGAFVLPRPCGRQSWRQMR